MLFQQVFDEIFKKNFVFNCESCRLQQHCGALRMSERPNFGDVLIRHFPPRFKKHAENITIFLQCLNRLNGKDAAVLGKQVLMWPGWQMLPCSPGCD